MKQARHRWPSTWSTRLSAAGLAAAGLTACLGIAVALLGPSALGCRYDPVPQDVIDRLPEEDDDGAKATHRSGQPCLACHSSYEGAEPALSIGGTVYTKNGEGAIAPAPNVLILITDSEGDSRKSCTNAGGNFFVERDKWEEPVFPLTTEVGSRHMRSLVGRDGSCATCHTLPNELSLDTVTGAGRSSAGVILVDANDTDPTCGGGIGGAGASGGTGGVAGSSGSGGAGGDSGGSGGGGGT